MECVVKAYGKTMTLVHVYWETQPAGGGMGGMVHATKAHWRERGADRTLCGRKVPEEKVAATQWRNDGVCSSCEAKGGQLRNIPAPPRAGGHWGQTRATDVPRIEVFPELL